MAKATTVYDLWLDGPADPMFKHGFINIWIGGDKKVLTVFNKDGDFFVSMRGEAGVRISES